MNYWVHNLDPVIFHIWGPMALRWYGLAYLLGFIGGWLILRHLSKRGEFAVPEKEIGSFIVSIAIFGVFLGGRLGYVLLYALDELLADPLFLLRVWEGGMASHGGMLGVLLVALWYAKKYRAPFLNITDGLAFAAPIGLFFGRIANFINGELWGRPATVPWAVIFPQAGDPVPVPRHPSQLYEACGEGLFLFITLALIRKTARGRCSGAASAMFLILYAVARITAEFFREPDSTVYFGWLTKGQLYSAIMILIAAGVILKQKLFHRNHGIME
ncbi:MAG: prolipoprotein diacylglyceryl transferase [Kiritimatiellales bacterium]